MGIWLLLGVSLFDCCMSCLVAVSWGGLGFVSVGLCFVVLLDWLLLLLGGLGWVVGVGMLQY